MCRIPVFNSFWKSNKIFQFGNWDTPRTEVLSILYAIVEFYVVTGDIQIITSTLAKCIGIKVTSKISMFLHTTNVSFLSSRSKKSRFIFLRIIQNRRYYDFLFRFWSNFLFLFPFFLNIAVANILDGFSHGKFIQKMYFCVLNNETFVFFIEL